MTLGRNNSLRIAEENESYSKNATDVVIDTLTRPSESNRGMTPQADEMI